MPLSLRLHCTAGAWHCCGSCKLTCFQTMAGHGSGDGTGQARNCAWGTGWMRPPSFGKEELSHMDMQHAVPFSPRTREPSLACFTYQYKCSPSIASKGTAVPLIPYPNASRIHRRAIKYTTHLPTSPPPLNEAQTPQSYHINTVSKKADWLFCGHFPHQNRGGRDEPQHKTVLVL